MSTTPQQMPGASGSSELAQLAPRLDELQRRSEALNAALEGAKKTRTMIMLAFLVFVIVAGWGFVSLANSIRSDAYKNRLLAELQKSVETNQDTFSKEAAKLVAGISPVVTAALQDQAANDMPLFMQVIDKQRDVLMTSLPERMSTKVETHHHALLRKHEKLLQEEFPTVQNPEVRERMMVNTVAALDRLVKKYYVDEFKKEFQAMSETWNDFPRADTPGADDPSLDKQLVGELLELVPLMFTGQRSLLLK